MEYDELVFAIGELYLRNRKQQQILTEMERKVIELESKLEEAEMEKATEVRGKSKKGGNDDSK